MPLRDRLAALLDRLCAAGAWLAVPLSLLLFAQWPLREVPGGHPQLANDVAQLLFALYVALALRHATRHGVHLRTGVFARRYGARTRQRIARAGAVLVLLPWGLAVLWLGAPVLWQSLRQLEGFPESMNPGYFVIKLAVGLLALLTVLQALLEGWPSAIDPTSDDRGAAP